MLIKLLYLRSLGLFKGFKLDLHINFLMYHINENLKCHSQNKDGQMVCQYIKWLVEIDAVFQKDLLLLGSACFGGSEFAKTSDRESHLFHKNIKNNDNTSSRLKTVTYTSIDSESFLKCSFELGSIP